MQSKIERFIHDVGLRKTMLRAHRQAWAWQDEWNGLTIADIRRLELEAQEELAQRMREFARQEVGQVVLWAETLGFDAWPGMHGRSLAYFCVGERHSFFHCHSTSFCF